jgi:SOS response regulatory protein OraA/RecX
MRFTYAAGAKPVPGYTIQRGLGRGGFGEVYQAVSDAGKDVALKLVQRHLDIELRGVRQCLNLKHANLVAIYDLLKTENDDNWIVMEYVAGESLAQVLTRHPQGIPEQMALAWMAGMCDGVAYLHECGLVHRDLTPGNIFVEKGVVKIGDYGLSKFISASRRSGHTESVGTVHYMAPEMSQGRYSKDVDQYALGIILVEMLTGRPPFDGESAGEILMKHLTAAPDLSRLAKPFRSIAERLLDKDPQRRYPSVSDLRAALPDLGPVRPSEVLRAEPGAPDARYSPTAKTITYIAASRRERADDIPGLDETFDESGVIELLTEQDWMADDIERVVLILRESPRQDTAAMVKAIEILVEHGWDAKGIERVLLVPRNHPNRDMTRDLRALEILAEQGWDAVDAERVLNALGKRSAHDAAGKLKALELLIEHGWEAKAIERVLHALGELLPHEWKGRLRALELLVEHGWEAEGIERVLHALGKQPPHRLKRALKVLETLLENSWEAEDIERILNALSEWPRQELKAKVKALESLIENGMEAEEIERVLYTSRRVRS